MPWLAGLAGAAIVVALAYAVFALVRSLPTATVYPARSFEAFPRRRPLRLAWPGQGEAAVGVDGMGLIGSHGSARPTPMASVAKVMTAYVVLHDHPLHGRASGPRITVTGGDMAAYRADLAGGQSVVLVAPGERLTERQALEALLLPSGNNVATLLAAWDAHSQHGFVAKMNATARSLGLAHTHYTDASGVHPGTVSTADDQVRLAMRAMQLPVFRQVVGLSQATLPVAGRLYNKDALLGRAGIVGIKTGTTSEAGACFVFAADRQLAGHQITVVGAVLHQLAAPGQPVNITTAFHASLALLASVDHLLVGRRVVRRGAPVAWLSFPWTSPAPLRAAHGVSLAGWPGLHVHATVVTDHSVSAPVAAGQQVGTLVLQTGQRRATVGLISAQAVPGPSLTWRLGHP